MSKEILIGAYSPMVNNFIRRVIRYIRSTNICYEDRVCIHSDLVPKVSERVMQASMIRPNIIPPFSSILEEDEPTFEYNLPKRDMSKLVEPIKRMYRRPVYTPNLVDLESPIENNVGPQITNSPPVLPSVPQIKEPLVELQDSLTTDYGKINDFLMDPTISFIECPGPGKPLVIIRAGQRQITRIFLTPEEIEEVIRKVSEESHIPSMEGVFRAAVENFVINAVISEMIGTRFVIKKNTPYSILDSNPYF